MTMNAPRTTGSLGAAVGSSLLRNDCMPVLSLLLLVADGRSVCVCVCVCVLVGMAAAVAVAYGSQVYGALDPKP